MRAKRLWQVILVAAAVVLASEAYGKSKKKKAPDRAQGLEPRVLLFDPESAETRPRPLVFGRMPDTVSEAPILLRGKDGKVEGKKVITDPAMKK